MSRRRPNPDDLRRAADVLESIVKERDILSECDAETKARLLAAARRPEVADVLDERPHVDGLEIAVAEPRAELLDVEAVRATRRSRGR